MNYLLKPVKYSILKMELDRYFSRYQGKDEPYLSFRNDSGKYKVLYKNLCYGETEKRNVFARSPDSAVYALLRNFRYCLQRKDAFVLTVGFLLAFSVSFASVYGYLNLQREDTLILDLATSILGVYFIVQFLYTKNISFLREQEQKDKIQIAQLKRQFDYYQEKHRDEEKVRSVYHDMKNHLLVLQAKLKIPETALPIVSLLPQNIIGGC